MERVIARPLSLAKAALVDAIAVDPVSVESLPDWKGAYLLVLQLGSSVRFARGGLSEIFLPGIYAYAGNAYGSGGVRSRLRRHFRRAKRPHWHIDHLANEAADVAAIAVQGGSECALVSSLLDVPGFAWSLEGFGSSDCRTCCSHLLAWRSTKIS